MESSFAFWDAQASESLFLLCGLLALNFASIIVRMLVELI